MSLFLIDYVLIPFAKILVVFLTISLVVAYLTLLERKVIAFMQVRLGPMRVGPYGLLQPIADGLKLLLKRRHYPGEGGSVHFYGGSDHHAHPGLHHFRGGPVRPEP